MSLAKRNDGKGCYECRMRRVRCDKTEPECFKCQKKGIKCSGQGIECRFSKHMNRKQTPSLGSPQLPAASSKASKRYLFVNVENTQDGALPTSSGQPGASTAGPSSSTMSIVVPHRSKGRELVRARQAEQFSTFIASKMVVLDFNENGYRQIVLPIACQDDLVAQAVSVIAAFHLSSRMPSMHMAAERGQELILSRLRQQSLNLGPGQLFNMSTLATLLVLLVGDTITGANNYVYLLELLSRLAKLAMNDPRLSDTTKAFILEQTKM
ncbi:Fungal transcriptional regulatory protein, partial [Metarhizium majus ARSEF 297]